MKGLLIGVVFATRGVYTSLSSLHTTTLHYTWHHTTRPSCGTGYYLIVLVIGAWSGLVYACVAWGYRYRIRDEPCHVYRYAEEYYSNIQTEEHF